DIEPQSRWIDFSCDDPTVPGGDENLVVRAAKAFLEKTKISSGVGIKLQKQIPHGAGLGGGSSDAASVLVALNKLFETKLSGAEFRRPRFRERSRATGLREIRFSRATERMAAETGGSWSGFDVRIRLDCFCGAARKRRCRSPDEARARGARS